jgi:tetratricopeptide (TPR) repeat protein
MRRPRTSTPLPRGLLAPLALAAAAAAASADAARAQPAAPGEFTRQAMLVLSFARDSGVDAKLGRQAGDAVRGRIEKLANGRELELLGGGVVRDRLQNAGFSEDEVFGAAALGYIARSVRGDEFLVGRVARAGGGVRLEAALHLVRDPSTRHRFAPVVGADLGEAAARLASAVVAARLQLAPDRRCRNALRDRKPAQALAAARAAIAGGADGAFVRSCQVIALGVAGAPPEERLQAARALLAMDSTSRAGLEGAALAADLLRRAPDAARYWVALAETDTADYQLTSRAAYALLDGGNARAVLPLVDRALRINPDSLGLVRLRWFAARDVRDLPLAIGAGERLLADDAAIARDSTFLGQLAEAYRATAQPIRAVELAARGASRFPGDQRLYALYARLVLAERDTVLARGLARFPKSAPLHVLAAQDLKSRGQAEAALVATRQAVALDSTLPQGILAVAQAEYELGRPDSALVALRRALAHGEDTATGRAVRPRERQRPPAGGQPDARARRPPPRVPLPLPRRLGAADRAVEARARHGGPRLRAGRAARDAPADRARVRRGAGALYARPRGGGGRGDGARGARRRRGRRARRGAPVPGGGRPAGRVRRPGGDGLLRRRDRQRVDARGAPAAGRSGRRERRRSRAGRAGRPAGDAPGSPPGPPAAGAPAQSIVPPERRPPPAG